MIPYIYTDKTSWTYCIDNRERYSSTKRNNYLSFDAVVLPLFPKIKTTSLRISYRGGGIMYPAEFDWSNLLVFVSGLYFQRKNAFMLIFLLGEKNGLIDVWCI